MDARTFSITGCWLADMAGIISSLVVSAECLSYQMSWPSIALTFRDRWIDHVHMSSKKFSEERHFQDVPAILQDEQSFTSYYPPSEQISCRHDQWLGDEHLLSFQV